VVEDEGDDMLKVHGPQWENTYSLTMRHATDPTFAGLSLRLSQQLSEALRKADELGAKELHVDIHTYPEANGFRISLWVK
jgi:hypothetical protein